VHRFYFLAKLFLQRLMAVQEARLPQDHVARALAATHLGEAYFMEDACEEAQALLVQALEHWLSAGPAHSPAAVPTMTLLAGCMQRLDNAAQALELREEALRIHLQGRSELDRQACTMATPLALLYAAMGRFEDAHALAQRTLAARQRLLGPKHPDVAETLGALSEICVQQHDLGGAEGHLRAAVELLRETALQGDPFLAAFLTKLAMLVAARGGGAQAEALFQEALQNFERDLPLLGLSATFVLRQLSELQYARGDLDAAQASLQDMLLRCIQSDQARPEQLLEAVLGHMRLAELLTERGQGELVAEQYTLAYALAQRLPVTEETAALLEQARSGCGAAAPAKSFVPTFGFKGYGAVQQAPVVRYH
jgi:tetratricopeptide (TPR) repeat protein